MNIMTNNEMTTNVGFATGEILVQETAEYSVYQLPNGKFEKRVKYPQEWSRVPETDEELIEFYKIMNESDNDKVLSMSDHVGSMFTIKNYYFTPYSNFDEDTGVSNAGVTTLLETTDGEYYATSSKTVYWTLRNMFQTFGTPGTEQYIPFKVAITGQKQKRGTQINLKLVGLAK